MGAGDNRPGDELKRHPSKGPRSVSDAPRPRAYVRLKTGSTSGPLPRGTVLAKPAIAGLSEAQRGDPMIWVVVAVVVVVVAVVGLFLARQQRSRQLKQGFGREYDRVVTEHGDQRAGERELRERRQRLDAFEIRPLEPSVRTEYLERWSATQRQFVDEPRAAVAEAQGLVAQVMRDRGYPVDSDFEQRAADVSVEHPEVVENYRAAHEISVRARSGEASTEQLRRAMVHYRALFDDLLAPAEDRQADRGDQTHFSQHKTQEPIK